ncbi:hypothetical protein ILUMI_10021 [Ignelater luminosus]|uniref:Cytochrome b-c1 complex subunit 2, mitochondrial n=1 Tax=Ignelater luminosus TaxID=2038154 RepID=A0A8K0GFE2_IGNLU|nr:hypothetical protein ILUMI_10021 [Ignelater luminosus]
MMATNITKAPILRAISIRGYAAAAGCPASKGIPVNGQPDYEIKTTVLPNKVVVASAENEALISRVSILFRAGARNETPDNLGTTHTLRICAGLSTHNASQFAITRNIQEVGSSLTCSTDREVVAYTLEGTRPVLEKTLPFLTEVATRQCFKPWEVSDNVPRLRLELATRPPQLRAVDLLHKAAYRSRGLGNSIYTAKHQLGKISSETLQHYVKQNFVANRAAVVGLGVDHQDLVRYAQSLQLEGGKADCEPADYRGGEIRSDKGGDVAHIAIAGKGGSFRNAKEALSFAVLQRALGAGSSIKYADENRGLLAKSLSKCSGPTSITALNISYTDSGLFGALISTPCGDAKTVVKDVVDILKGGSIPDEDIARGKAQLTAAVLHALESGSTAIEDIGNQAVLIGSVANACQIANAISGLNSSDINNALKKITSSKLSIASVGNLRCVPFLDELV